MIVTYLEHQEGGKLPKSALVSIKAALTAKAKHGYSKAVGILIGGSSAKEAASTAATYGLDEVVYFSHETLTHYLSVNFADVITKACQELGGKLVLAASSSLGKDLMPGVAQKLNAGQASDVIEFLDGGKFRRPMFAGNVLADVEITTDIKVATLRISAFDAAEAGGNCNVRELSLDYAPSDKQKFISFDSVKSERPELTEAEIVISAGRGIKSKENIESVIMPLADVLGAAVGASRAAVDSGYAPNDWQVGQTGKVVAPNLYFAIGISGAIQHLAGMKDSKVIVAINKDPEAPIFEVADYGLVADLFEVVPELTEELKKSHG